MQAYESYATLDTTSYAALELEEDEVVDQEEEEEEEEVAHGYATAKDLEVAAGRATDVRYDRAVSVEAEVEAVEAVEAVEVEEEVPKLRLTRGISDEATSDFLDSCLTSSPLSSLVSSVAQSMTASVEKYNTVAGVDVSWNTRYQLALDLPQVTAEQREVRFTLLARISNDFREAAERYGRTIIAELTLSDSQRTIHPDPRFGGVAGGDKFVVAGILFKLAKDTRPSEEAPFWLYGGLEASQEYAQKGAGAELRGAVQYFAAQKEVAAGEEETDEIARVRVPLQCLVDYRGFRLVAMPLLPLQRMIYGSRDAGVTVLNEDEGFAAGMQKMSTFLHLKSHATGRAPGRELHSAGDVEGHVGHDDKFYLLDLARTFPPESPVAVKGHLSTPGRARPEFFRHLRPELLRILRRRGSPALNPDAFTNWGVTDPNFRRHMADVHEATRYMLRELVPEFAAFLQQYVDPDNAAEVQSGVSMLAHKRGINVRHLGLVRSHLQDAGCTASELLLVECVKRTLKNLLRYELRRATEHAHSDFELRHRVVGFLNLVSGSDSHSADFWQLVVRPGVVNRFGQVALRGVPVGALADGVTRSLLHIVEYVLRSIGAQLSEQCRRDCAAEPNLRDFQFSTADVEEGPLPVKFITILSFAEALMLSSQAERLFHESADSQGIIDSSIVELSQQLDSRTSAGVSRLLKLSEVRFGQSLLSDPTHHDALWNKAMAQYRRLVISGEDQTADLVVLSTIRDGVFEAHLFVQALQYLNDQLAQRRRSKTLGRRAYLEFGGASSDEVLVKTTELIEGERGRAAEQIYRVEMQALRQQLALMDKYRFVSAHVLWDALRSDKQCEPLLRLAGDLYDKDGHPRFAVSFAHDPGMRLSAYEMVSRDHSLKRRLQALLLDAARHERFMLVSLLAELGVGVDERDATTGATLLHNACRRADLDLTQGLLKCGASPHLADKNGETPLLRAVQARRADLVAVLLDAGASAEVFTVAGETPLTVACSLPHSASVELLLQHPCLINHSTPQSSTPLMVAVRRLHAPIVHRLLQAGARLDIRDSLERSVWTKLFLSPRIRSAPRWAAAASILRALFEHGRPPPDMQPVTMLKRIIGLGLDSADMVEAVLECSGLSVHDLDEQMKSSRMENEPLLHKASRKGLCDVVRLLLRIGYNGSAELPHLGRFQWSALMHAVAGSSKDTVRLLIDEGGARVNRVTDYGATLLHIAAEHSSLDMTCFLVREVGVALDAVDSAGRTALFIAARYGRDQHVRALLLLGSDPNQANRYGSRPLHVAAQFDQMETVRVLLEFGAVDMARPDGKTAQVLARGETVELLRKPESFLGKLFSRKKTRRAGREEHELQELLDVEAAELKQRDLAARSSEGHGESTLRGQFDVEVAQADGAGASGSVAYRSLGDRESAGVLRTLEIEYPDDRGMSFFPVLGHRTLQTYVEHFVENGLARGLLSPDELTPGVGLALANGDMLDNTTPVSSLCALLTARGVSVPASGRLRLFLRGLRSAADVEREAEFWAPRDASAGGRSVKHAMRSLLCAVSYRLPTLVELLLRRYNADPDTSDRLSGDSVLSLAVQLGYTDCVESLLLHGASPNYQNPYTGETPIMRAVDQKEVDMLELVLRRSVVPVNINVLDSGGRSALMRACRSRNMAAVAALVGARLGVDVDVAEPSHGRTALHEAASKGDADVVRLLIDAGASCDVLDARGRSPLAHASQHGHLDVVMLLIEDGAVHVRQLDGGASFVPDGYEAINAPSPADGSDLMVKVSARPASVIVRNCYLANPYHGFPTLAPAGVALHSGRWFFEVEVDEPSDVLQVGWAKAAGHQPDGETRGVGDDKVSWSYDPSRSLLFYDGEADPIDRPHWSSGDTLTCTIDLDKRTMGFYMNGELIVSPFEGFEVPAEGVRPELSLGSAAGCSVLFAAQLQPRTAIARALEVGQGAAAQLLKVYAFWTSPSVEDFDVDAMLKLSVEKYPGVLINLIHRDRIEHPKVKGGEGRTLREYAEEAGAVELWEAL